ncbi:hypothetical protein LWI28_016595 [Acer negundo]|uniref:Uncharacterized protein n=1 Tax=Acer negundo TaxID=4023 RepID=A0AAD5IQG4_ACENE|nr:hypothetical protein LWI28_016595 [Acer negundo]
MASRTDPQQSIQTYDSPEESSTEPPPIIEEPPDYHVPGQPHGSRPTNGPWFDLGDLNPDSWRKKISEMSAWLDLQMANSEHNQEAILREFISRFTGSLRDWYQALGEYRQLQIVRAASTSVVMGIIFREFLGDPDQFYKQARQEFFEMRCCSLRKKDIDFHYKLMSSRYHILGDDVPSDADIESIFSEQDHADDNTTFVLQAADFISTISDSEYSSLYETDSLPVSYKATLVSLQATHSDAQPGPQVPIQILPDKYANPVDVIAYIDTGSITTMMNPKVLPSDAWKSHVRYFKVADGKIFTTNLITKAKIGLKIFPSYTLWTRVIGTTLPDKDILYWLGCLLSIQVSSDPPYWNQIQTTLQSILQYSKDLSLV